MALHSEPDSQLQCQFLVELSNLLRLHQFFVRDVDHRCVSGALFLPHLNPGSILREERSGRPIILRTAESTNVGAYRICRSLLAHISSFLSNEKILNLEVLRAFVMFTIRRPRPGPKLVIIMFHKRLPGRASSWSPPQQMRLIHLEEGTTSVQD